jgi:probable phosphoglycerate mutase
MKIYLVRHGETEANVARIVQTPDVPLSQRGRVQAECLAQRLARADIATIVSSDLQRAVMTAECVQAASGARLVLDAALQERNFGDLRGRPYADIGVDIFAPEYAPPGGESWDVFHDRVDRMWRRVGRLTKESGGHLAVITHGLVCHSLALRCLQLPPGASVPIRWANTAVTVIEGRPPWTVHVLNCTAHLDTERNRGQGP